MKAVEIKKGIYWVGGIDWSLRNFHGYLTLRGSTYNAYLIVDEKIVLVDTVKHYLFDEMLERIKTVIDPSKIDYIVSNHVEMDHSGAIPQMVDICKDAVILTSPNGEKGLKLHFGDNYNYKAVQSGESLDTGSRKLRFVLTPMVHWPDSMVTYIPEDKLLLSNDAFGQHLATSERFDDELNSGILMEEAAKYYANIVLPFGTQVNKALDAASGLEIDMIAPSHGVIWRKGIVELIKNYRSWANNETRDKAIIVYDTMWGSTEKMAFAVYRAFEAKGINAMLMDLKSWHISDIITQLLDSKYICIGSPTLNNNMLPTVAAFLTYMKGLSPKKRTAMAFGSYGWGGQSVNQIEEVLKACEYEMLLSAKLQYVPGEEQLVALRGRLEEVL